MEAEGAVNIFMICVSMQSNPKSHDLINAGKQNEEQ